MEHAFLSDLDQHLLMALSACLTLYIGARSVKTRLFTPSPPHPHFTRTIALSTLPSRSRGAGWHLGPSKILYPARYMFPLTRKPSILLTLVVFFFSSRISYSELYISVASDAQQATF